MSILIQSDNRYFMMNTKEDNINEVYDEIMSELIELQPFFQLGLLSVVYEEESKSFIMIRIPWNSFITISDREEPSIFHRIPYHETLTKSDYISYFLMIYVCTLKKKFSHPLYNLYKTYSFRFDKNYMNPSDYFELTSENSFEWVEPIG